MEIKISYKGITQDGINGIWCGFRPNDIIVKEEILILYPDKGKYIKNKATEEIITSIVLQSIDEQTNYEEVEIQENISTILE